MAIGPRLPAAHLLSVFRRLHTGNQCLVFVSMPNLARSAVALCCYFMLPWELQSSAALSCVGRRLCSPGGGGFGCIRGKLKPLGRHVGRVGLKAFLKDVVFGVDANQYYVRSEWGQSWNSGKASLDVLGQRKAAGNSTASFGAEGQHYLEFPDTIYFGIRNQELRGLVKQHATEFVSFGPKGATFVVLKSGAYYFRNIPLELQDAVTGRARSGNEDHNRVASVTLGNDAYFVIFKDGWWQYKGIPTSMSEYITEHIKPDEVFEQVSFSQDLEQWYLRTNKRWWYQSKVLRNIEDTYKPKLQADKADVQANVKTYRKQDDDDDYYDDDLDDDDDYYDDDWDDDDD